MKDKQIVFTKKDTAELLEKDVPIVGDNDVCVKTCISTISCGTEKANISGEHSVSINTDKDIPFPRANGYSSAGIVTEIGKNVKSVAVGDRVCMFLSFHRQYNVLNESLVVKINDGITMNEASLFYIASFPLAAVRKTQLEIGESMMVMGLGVLGLLGVGFAHAAGATPVIAVDPIKERRQKALNFGADYAFDPFDKDFVQKVKEVTNGGVNCAVEVTGMGAGLNETLDCMARFGRVSLLGCTRHSDFTVDYYRKVHGPGIKLIGAHSAARPDIESAPSYFTARDDILTSIKLSSLKRLDFNSLIDEVHSPEECFDVYTRLVKSKDFPTIVQFDWSLLK